MLNFSLKPGVKAGLQFQHIFFNLIEDPSAQFDLAIILLYCLLDHLSEDR